LEWTAPQYLTLRSTRTLYPIARLNALGHNPCTIVTLRFVVENGQKTFGDRVRMSFSSEIAGTNPKVMAVRSKVNIDQKNLIMSLADSCFEFLRDLEKEHDPDLVRRRAAEFAEDVPHYSRLIELT
jgi:hypothetical protein